MWFISDYIFGSKKDSLFWHVTVFRRGKYNSICDTRSPRKSKNRLNTSLFQHSKAVFVIQCSTESHMIFLNGNELIYQDFWGKFRSKRIHLFFNTAFVVWFLNFSLKEENMRDVDKSKCGWISALHNSLLNEWVRNVLWRYGNFSLLFIFLRTFDAVASSLNL